LLSGVLRAQENTALFNCKIEEKKAISVAEHLAEGLSTKGTSRLVGVSAQAIRRLRRSLGDHSREFHDERVKNVESTSVQMDERYGYVRSKKEPFWEATSIDPQSRLLIGLVVGRRNEALIKELMESTKRRLKEPNDLVVMSDGEKAYESLFASVFGEPYRVVARKGDRGRFERRRATASKEASPTSYPHQAPSGQESRGGEIEGGAWFLEAGAQRAREAGLQGA
jgi:transposase-like protein